MAPEPSVASWKDVGERGAPILLRLIVWIARRAGRRAARPLLLPIAGYFLLTARQARRASRQFLRRALQRPPTLRDVARHIHTFAAVILDRFVFLLGRADQMAIRTHRTAEEEQGTYHGSRGSLLFVSHLGSFESLRTLAHPRMPMKVLLDRSQTRMLTSLLEAVNPGFLDGIIDVSQPGPGLALQVKQALDERCRVGIMVDRARPGERTVKVQFFGAPAPFPAGPWLLAAALQARVVLAFSLYRGGNRYDTHHELFTEKLVIPRAQREEELQRCVQQYASRLEHYARMAPYNWFNFYDFWNETAPH
jgi:predicted LPLAT superfamily acyltransferase